MASIGEKIRSLRKALGMTLDEFATEIGASKSSVWELENKETVRPSADRINAVARALNVTPEFLLDDKAVSPSANVADQAFFRRYQQLSDPTKQQLHEILKVLDRKDPD